MKIVHVGPPLARTGGPAGYLLQLKDAASSSRHEVSFPAPAAPPRPRAAGPSYLRRQLGRAARAVLGPARQFRPSLDDMAQKGGRVAELYARSKRDSSARTMESLEGTGAASDADVLFVHDPLALDAVLERRGNAEVWLLVHSPMPMGLYIAWNWGLPEAPWQEIAALPDVRDATLEEIEWWRRVDRVVFPCREAYQELVRVDAGFAEVDTPHSYILTGSGDGTALPPAPSRARWKLPEREPVGVFLGNGLAYRGLDVLVDAVSLLPSRRELPGVIALAGPDPATLSSHPRLARLGRVDDVPSLLASVDFLVNTNRFSLFDLSNIEAAAAGTAFLLHAVGGNETLQRLGAGCEMFNELSPERVAEALTVMFTKPRDELGQLGERSRECHRRHLTAEHMWHRHVELYDEVASLEAARA